jgi:hypothetical protein
MVHSMVQDDPSIVGTRASRRRGGESEAAEWQVRHDHAAGAARRHGGMAAWRPARGVTVRGGRYAMTMEEDWVWMPHKTATPAVHMAISVPPRVSAPAPRVRAAPGYPRASLCARVRLRASVCARPSARVRLRASVCARPWRGRRTGR